jgi:hypothetical protein
MDIMNDDFLQPQLKYSSYVPYLAMFVKINMREAILSELKKKKGKAIPVTGREGPHSCETSRLPHFL